MQSIHGQSTVSTRSTCSHCMQGNNAHNVHLQPQSVLPLYRSVAPGCCQAPHSLPSLEHPLSSSQRAAAIVGRLPAAQCCTQQNHNQCTFHPQRACSQLVVKRQPVNTHPIHRTTASQYTVLKSQSTRSQYTCIESCLCLSLGCFHVVVCRSVVNRQ